MRPQTELERLDFVAKSYSGGANAGLSRALLTGLAIFIVLLATGSEAPRHETILVRAIAVVVAVSVLASWAKKRYSGYGWAATCLSASVGAFVSNDYSRTVLGWAVRLTTACCMVYIAFCLGRMALRASVVHRDAWKKELAQVKEWTALIQNSEAPDVLYFYSESFWTGYFTFRILNAGSWWVIAKSKKGKEHRIIDCRVVPLDSVRRTDAEPRLQVVIDGRPVRSLKMSPQTQNRLLAYAK